MNDKHYLLNRDNLMETIQMQLSEKQKTFPQFFFFFFAFLKSILHFKHLADVFPEILAPKNMVCNL